MHRRFILAVALAGLAYPSFATDKADVVHLSAVEVAELLTGNTITGTWSGSGYDQYFADNGLTVYIPANGRIEHGRWRTNADTGQYESLWVGGSWTGYTVAKSPDGYGWVRGDGLEMFTVAEGKQISW